MTISHDQMSTHLSGRLNYAKGERDMILMRHEVIIIHLHNLVINLTKLLDVMTDPAHECFSYQVTVKWPDNRRELKGINLVSF